MFSMTISIYHRRHSKLLGIIAILCCLLSVAATSSSASSSTSSFISRQWRSLQTTLDNNAGDEEADEDDKKAMMMMDDDGNYGAFDDPTLMEDHFDTQDNLPPPAEKTSTETPPPPPVEKVEEVPEVVYDDFDAIAPDDPKSVIIDNEGGEVEASDGGVVEEVDVEEKAKELLQDATEDMDVLLGGGETKGSNGITESSTTATATEQPATYSSTTAADSKRKAWVAHGTIGTLIFGLLLPTSISSAFFRDLIPGYWIYIHVFVNVTTFVLTFFTVGIAFATMAGMGNALEGHLKEVHHIVGLLLLLLISFQTANGFLRPPREFTTDDEHDSTPGAIHRNDTKSFTTRTIWYLTHAGTGLFIFSLGTYQVYSGMGLFSRNYNTSNWGSVYLGYIFWIVLLITGGKIWFKLKQRKIRRNAFEMQLKRGGSDEVRSSYYDGDDSSSVSDELGSLQFQQV
jgi:hypothetical protein